jgi:RNA polymerase sigma factor (TIGR02999 family)
MRLVGSEDPGWNSRGHFFGAAARAMRRILVDYARHKGAAKRGGDWKRLDIDDVPLSLPGSSTDVIALDEVLRELEQGAPRATRVVEHRYFAGLTVDETAESLDVSRSTVEREWRFARAFLRTRLEDRGGAGP